MVNGQKYKVVILLFYLCSSLFISGCIRKDLYYGDTSTISLQMDVVWPNKVDEPPRFMHLIFFPTNAGQLQQDFYLETDNDTIDVRSGEYRMLLYNWRTNANSQTVQFRNKEDFFEMEAFTGRIYNKAGYFDDYDVRLQPDILYSWAWLLEQTKMLIKSDNFEKAPYTVRTYPSIATKRYNFHVKVIGLEYVRSVSLIAAGFAPSIKLYNKSVGDESIAHKVDISVTEEGFQCSFAAFRHNKELQQKLYFIIKLPDNSRMEVYRDLSKELNESNNITDVEPIEIKYDGPILPPDVDGGFEPPVIDDWESNDEDIYFPT